MPLVMFSFRVSFSISPMGFTTLRELWLEVKCRRARIYLPRGRWSFVPSLAFISAGSFLARDIDTSPCNATSRHFSDATMPQHERLSLSSSLSHERPAGIDGPCRQPATLSAFSRRRRELSLVSDADVRASLSIRRAVSQLIRAALPPVDYDDDASPRRRRRRHFAEVIGAWRFIAWSGLNRWPSRAYREFRSLSTRHFGMRCRLCRAEASVAEDDRRGESRPVAARVDSGRSSGTRRTVDINFRCSAECEASFDGE